MKTYELGNEVKFHVVFAEGGIAANPTNVNLFLRDPHGVVVEPPIANSATGTFAATFTPQLAGVWHYRWQGTGNFWAAQEDTFEITSSDFGG